MNAEQITHLIAVRNSLTNRRDELIDYDAVDHIDALLREVPAGERNDVDLLLGRSCAVLPKRVIMVQHADGTIEVNDATRANYIPHAVNTLDDIVPIADAKMQEYAATWRENAKDWEDLKGDCAL